MTNGIDRYLYQAKSGAIYLARGRYATRLTHAQLWQLGLALPDLHQLNDFDEDAYLDAYKSEKEATP